MAPTYLRRITFGVAPLVDLAVAQEVKLLLKPRQDSAERDCAILWATKRNADGLNLLQVATKYGHAELVNLIHGLWSLKA